MDVTMDDYQTLPIKNLTFQSNSGVVYDLQNTFFDVDNIKANSYRFDGEINNLNKELNNLQDSISIKNNLLECKIEEIVNKLNRTISLVHNCANCGAQLHIEENKPVFHCKYCGSTYLIGTAHIYSNY